MKPLPYFTIIDRYFMKKFLFVASALIFIGASLFMLFDILSKSDDLPILFEGSKTHGIVVLLQFYTLRMMNILLYTQFAFIMATTAITFFMLEKNSSMTVRGGEVIPLLSSGFSRKRVSAPFFLVGCTFVFFMCFTEEAFYTYCRDWPGANSNSLVGKTEIKSMDMRNDESTGLKIYGTDLDLESKSFLNPKIGIPKERTLGQLDELLAQKAVWLPECDEHPAGFMLEGVMDMEKKNWLPRAANVPVWLPHLKLNLPVFYTSERTSWVPPGNIFIISMLLPEDLTKDKLMFLPDSIPDLYRKINNKRQLGPNYRERVELHSRLLRPFLECSLLFLSIPVILSARLRSKIVIFLIIAALTGLDVGLTYVGKQLVIQDGFPSVVGAWIPLCILAPVCTFLFEELYT